MKSVLKITCSECQTHLLAFLHHDVNPLLRRQLARHLDHCPRCYATYRSELDLMQNLAHELPLMGARNQPDFNAIWKSVQTEIQRPKPGIPQFQARYGLAMLVFALVLLLPLTLGNQNLSLSTPPTQPRPVIAHLPPSSTIPKVTETTIAYLTNQSLSTPEAPHHAIGLLAADVVSTP
jgi:hypothetical protein